jgi:hypothetical protein
MRKLDRKGLVENRLCPFIASALTGLRLAYGLPGKACSLHYSSLAKDLGGCSRFHFQCDVKQGNQLSNAWRGFRRGVPAWNSSREEAQAEVGLDFAELKSRAGRLMPTAVSDTTDR